MASFCLFILCFYVSFSYCHKHDKNWDPVTSLLCRANCLYQLLEPEDAREDGACAIEPDCNVCWENCGILAAVSNTSREIFCNGDQCYEGCKMACDYFKKPKSRSPSQLIFQGDPRLKGDCLEWTPVPNASLYSVVLVYINKTRLNIAQTVSTSLDIPKQKLIKVNRIIVIAANDKGAVGLANFNIPKKMVRKNINSTLLPLENVLSPSDKIQLNRTLNMSSILAQALWITQNQIVRLNKTFVKTNISWNFKNEDDYQGGHQYMIKWWVPDFNVEGTAIVNSSKSMEMIYRLGHICLVKVKVLTSDSAKMESQIIVLKREFVDPKISQDYYTIDNLKSLLLGCIFIFCAICLLKTYFSNVRLTKSQPLAQNNFQNDPIT